MQPFVRYYDAIYSDKDYRSDCSILRGLVPAPSRPKLLEIGSGTGNQTALLREWADVTAVETDKDFAAMLREKLPAQFLFERDIGALDQTGFDGAAAYFHVINYIHEASALTHLFAQTAQRLKPGAPFLFDMWHAECVLYEPPRATTRSKDYDNHVGKGRVIQSITPTLDAAQRNVTLHYAIEIDGQGFVETIALHLWQRDEIVSALQHAGFTDVAFFDGRAYPQAATKQSWALWVTARKKE